MALKSGWPAIRAEWLEGWFSRGTLRALPVPGTPILIVDGDYRPFKICWRSRNSQTVKIATRYWLGEGTILHPKWVPLSQVFDPVRDAGVQDLPTEELKARRMYRKTWHQVYVLIFQHVESALHLERQLQHIEEQYQGELARIRQELFYLEALTLKTFDDWQMQRTCRLNTAERHWRERDIDTIRTILASRSKAAEILMDRLQRGIDRARKSLQASLLSSPMTALLAGRDTNTQSFQAYLERISGDFNDFRVRPLVTQIKRTQRHLQAAIEAVEQKNGPQTKQEILFAIKALDAALPLLKHPPEKLEVLEREPLPKAA